MMFLRAAAELVRRVVSFLVWAAWVCWWRRVWVLNALVRVAGKIVAPLKEGSRRRRLSAKIRAELAAWCAAQRGW